MKLNFEQIKSITQGAVRIEENDGFSFYRFNCEEQALYANKSSYKWSLSTAGIQMLFLTDGDVLNLKVNTSGCGTRSYFSFDILVNDELVNSLRNFEDSDNVPLYPKKEFSLGDFEGVFELGKGEKTVRIVFPWSVIAKINEISIDNATFIEPVKREKTILMYGDSITHGYDAMHSSQSYSSRLAHYLDAEVYNKAIGGEVFFPELAEVKNDIEPDYITVAYGTNDWSKTTKEVFLQNSRKFYEAVVKNYPNARIFAIAPIWRKDMVEYREFGDFKDVHKIIEGICNDLGINFISGWEFIPQDENYFADLRLHPNDEGFRLYFESLKRAMLPNL